MVKYKNYAFYVKQIPLSSEKFIYIQSLTVSLLSRCIRCIYIIIPKNSGSQNS